MANEIKNRSWAMATISMPGDTSDPVFLAQSGFVEEAAVSPRRTGAGVYRINLPVGSYLPPVDRVTQLHTSFGAVSNFAVVTASYAIVGGDVDEIEIHTFNAAGAAADIAGVVELEIRRYPQD